MTFSVRALALSIVLALFGAACGGSDPSTETAAVAANTDSSDAGADAPDAGVATDTSGTDSGQADDATVSWEHDFTGELLGGGQIDGNDLAGQDLVLWFWAPW